MQHKGTKLLETERLVLRQFTIDDTEAMFNNWASDNEVTKYLTWPFHTNLSVTSQVLENWIARYSSDSFYQWAIVLKETSEPIGSISVVEKISDKIKKAHIGYCIGKYWWHLGITSEALSRVIDFMFDEVGVYKVESRHDPRNPNSGAVMKKCGMKFEGTLRQCDWNNQGICDASYYGMLASER